MNYDLTVRVLEGMKPGDANLRQQVFRAAIRYANIRVEWLFMTSEERSRVNTQRTDAHNAFIDAVNALSRSMEQAGQNNGWRRWLGDDRKVIGDFACLLVAHLGILAR